MPNLATKLGIEPGSYVRVIRPNPATLGQLRREVADIKVLTDGKKAECDVVLYRAEDGDDFGRQMLDLEVSMRPGGRIWLILPKKPLRRQQGWTKDWEDIQKAISYRTHLVGNKVARIDDEEYGTQFMRNRERND
jgi:hypothetical protein